MGGLLEPEESETSKQIDETQEKAAKAIAKMAKTMIEENEAKKQIERINNELDEQQKIMIKMNFFENKSHKKIADELEIPLGTVKSRLRHILTKMQEFLR